jgi:hypothetical protein
MKCWQEIINPKPLQVKRVFPSFGQTAQNRGESVKLDGF